jgi:hypothetical protein
MTEPGYEQSSREMPGLADSNVAPYWSDDAVVKGVWVDIGETPHWIAKRTDALARLVGSVLSVPEWRVQQQRWAGDLDDLAEIVRAHPSTGSRGTPDPKEGYHFALSGEGIAPVQVIISAGDTYPHGRQPLHSALVDFPTDTPALSTEEGEGTLAALVEAFSPLMASLSTADVNLLSRRGGWKIPAAYRLWLHDTVGPIAAVAEDVTVSRVGDGTLLAVPDHWEPRQVVDATLRTLELNGLDELPH